MRNRAFVALSVFFLAAIAAIAKPNFTGDWKLNTTKSDFGQMPPPNSMTEKIAHEDPNLHVQAKTSSDMGDMEFDLKFTTDGKECSNTVMDNPSKSIVKWDGDALLFDTKGKFGDNDFTMKDKWTLSDDGKVLTLERHMSSSFGEADQKLVLEKQ